MWGMIGWAMELRHLRYFIAVAEELSFTRAAQKIRLAQPSLTRQIRNLEEEIGVRLINRSHNQVALTEEGKRFLFDAKKVLAMCTESIVAVRLMSQGESKQLNIGYVANLHYSLLPATLGAFRKLYPTVALNLFDMTRSEQYLAIESHKIDLGFVGLPPNLSDHNLLSESVAHDTIVVAVPAGHPPTHGSASARSRHRTTAQATGLILPATRNRRRACDPGALRSRHRRPARRGPAPPRDSRSPIARHCRSRGR